jgi:hypothetical protein
MPHCDADGRPPGDGHRRFVYAPHAAICSPRRHWFLVHQAARPAVVQVLFGMLRSTVDGEDLVAGSWLHMAPGAPHSLTATEPTAMLLTLFGS